MTERMIEHWAFIAKAVFAAENAIDAEIVRDIHNLLHVKSAPLSMPSEFKFGDKVKIVILRDESKND